MADQDGVIEFAHLRFTRERVEKVRNGHRVTSIAREGARWLVVKNRSDSEHPARESVWAVGMGAGAVLTLRSAWMSASLPAAIAGTLLALTCVLLVRHLSRTTTVVEVVTSDSRGQLAFEERLSDDAIRMLNRRLEDELGWPVTLKKARRKRAR